MFACPNTARRQCTVLARKHAESDFIGSQLTPKLSAYSRLLEFLKELLRNSLIMSN